ncbi:drug/metabolite transporter (DMT)-like permease [Azospirillum agricola]|uniref:DMT family transporter n=1 Tax=Azospirillum agricola TaxID=1720247 RepID=UPI001AE44F68|nr:DMT family transporter [Azospirillum agricola]MBP2231697.1 drug/metabolite transporter (DMT)-like permease [Azospirillum agricola]
MMRPLHRPLACGTALIVGSMLLFSLSDVFAKQLARSVHPVEIAWLRCLGAVFLLLPVVAARPELLRSARPGAQIARGLSLLASTTLLIAALRHLGLAEATMLVFMSPFILTALSALLFGDRVSGSHWAAVGIGLAGVAVVVRPGMDGMTAAAALPILSSLCWAVGMLCTRRIGIGDPPVTTLVWSVAVGLVAASLAVPFHFTPLDAGQAIAAAGMAAAWTTAHFCIVLAYRTHPAWQLAPFSYSQVVWSVILGHAVFAELPDALAFLGSALILSGGLLAALRRPAAAAREREA